jgi:hypothetical protein
VFRATLIQFGGREMALQRIDDPEPSGTTSTRYGRTHDFCEDSRLEALPRHDGHVA